MGNIRSFYFSTNFHEEKPGILGIQVKREPPLQGESVPPPSKASNGNPVVVSADVEAQKIKVELYENAIQRDTERFKLELDPSDESEYTKLEFITHWEIIHNRSFFSESAVLVKLLPEKLNILAIRVLLLPVELAWRGIKFVGELGWSVTKFIAKTGVRVFKFLVVTPKWILDYITEGCAPGNVNITVGGPEG